MDFCVFTLGCKVNLCESNEITDFLAAEGYSVTQKLVCADYYIINTCAVTSVAVQKSKQCIAKAKKLNAKSKIIIMGCASKFDKDKFDNADYIFGTQNKVKHIESLLNNLDIKKNCVNVNKKMSRNVIKIQDGCKNFCSYCIIPYLRKEFYSVPIEQIQVALDSCKGETVFAGINISSYGIDINSSLKKLLSSIKYNDRIRLGSIDCNIIDSELLNIISQGNFAHHFHISLQSGSNKILKDMNRKYLVSDYLRKIELIYNILPQAAVTTDIIVGYPTESEQDFIKTCDVAKKAKFAEIHIFPFSSRKNTKAFSLKMLDTKIVNERKQILKELSTDLKNKFMKKMIGTEQVVYTQKNGKFGITSNYQKVLVNAKGEEKYNVKIMDKNKDYLLGQIIT